MKYFAIIREFRSIRRYIDPDMAFLNLRMEHVDALILDETVASYDVWSKRNAEYRILQENFGEEEYGVAVSKQNEVLLRTLGQVLEQMRADGTIAQISKKWFGEDRT